MSPEQPLRQVLRDAISETRTLASLRNLIFVEFLGGPASANDVAAAEETLGRPLAQEHYELLTLHNGIVLSAGPVDPQLVRATFRAFSCEEGVEETMRLRNDGYDLSRGYAIGKWDLLGDRFLIMPADVRGCDGIVNASPDDPSSFRPPFTYPDIRTWLSAEIPKLCD